MTKKMRMNRKQKSSGLNEQEILSFQSKPDCVSASVVRRYRYDGQHYYVVSCLQTYELEAPRMTLVAPDLDKGPQVSLGHYSLPRIHPPEHFTVPVSPPLIFPTKPVAISVNSNIFWFFFFPLKRVVLQ
jgi:hypothetical protein